MDSLVNRLQQKKKSNTRKANEKKPPENQENSAISRSDGSHEETDVAENAERRYGDSAVLLESESAPPIEAPTRFEEENEESLINPESQDNSLDRIAEEPVIVGQPPREALSSAIVQPSSDELFGIYVHATDRLKTTLYIAHPLIRVYLLDYETGQFLKRSKRFGHLAVLIDHVSDNLRENENGDQKIAWAFLKLIGGNNQSNCGKKQRLQLFRAPRRKKGETAAELEVYHWWKNLPRVKYTGTLYVTVKGVATTVRIPNDTLDTNTRALTDGQDNPPTVEQDPVTGSREKIEVPIWSRLPGQSCKIPNKKLQSIAAGKLGAITLRFSSDGCFLACASKESNTKFPIHIHEFPNGRSRSILLGHLQLTYDLCWSKNSEALLSASADCTARLWTVDTCMCIQVYPHTTFVYCAKFHPTDETIALTGAFDKIIRIWRTTKGIEGELLGELPGHTGCINCIQLSFDGKRLFSGDGQGTVKVWRFVGEAECEPPYLTFVRHVRDEQLQGQMISSIHVPPSNQLIAVQTRNSGIRLLDLRTNSLRSEFAAPSSYSTSLNCRATMTPCGTFAFCGNAEGSVRAWRMEDGQKVAEYTDQLDAQLPILCVEYHPLDHYVVFSQFGEGARIFVYGHDSSAPEVAQQPSTARKLQTEEQVDTQDGYTDFTLRTLLEEHRILTKLDSFEKAALEAIEARTEKAEGESAYHPIVVGTQRQLSTKTSFDSPKLERQNTEIAEYAAFEAAPDRQKEIISGPTGQENIDESPEAEQSAAFQSIFATAIFDYDRSNEDELSFQKGETLEIASQSDEHWWVAKKGDLSGYVPANYFQIIDSQ